jgi:hypothetical protein
MAEFYAQIRRETTALTAESTGEPRMRKLRAEGALMDRDQVCAYARIHIDNYLSARQH